MKYQPYMNLNDLLNLNSAGAIMFKKIGKNQYLVINKQGTEVGETVGQSRYWYLMAFDLWRYYAKKPTK